MINTVNPVNIVVLRKTQTHAMNVYQNLHGYILTNHLDMVSIMEDKCIVCGDYVPEGRQVCISCERKILARVYLYRRNRA